MIPIYCFLWGLLLIFFVPILIIDKETYQYPIKLWGWFYISVQFCVIILLGFAYYSRHKENYDRLREINYVKVVFWIFLIVLNIFGTMWIEQNTISILSFLVVLLVMINWISFMVYIAILLFKYCPICIFSCMKYIEKRKRIKIQASIDEALL